MKTSTKDKVKGKIHEVKGTVKEITGNLTDDPKLEAEGKAEKWDGKVQNKIGQLKQLFEK